MTVPAIMTIREVAEALRCSKSHVYKMIQYGKLPGYTVAGKQVCKADDVTALCASSSAVHDGISKGARDMTVLTPDENRTLTVLRNEAEAARNGTMVVDGPDIEMAELLDDAADEIELLREENERLRSMLESTIETVSKWKIPLPLAQTGDEG